MFSDHSVSIASSVRQESPADCSLYRSGTCAAKRCVRCNETRLRWGALAVVLYGLGSVYISFEISTAAFLVTWLLLAHSPIAVSKTYLEQEQDR